MQGGFDGLSPPEFRNGVPAGEKSSGHDSEKIPQIVNDEFQQGNIRSKKAIFTIGIFHLHNLITYLKERGIRIRAPLPASDGNRGPVAELNLKKESFGVSIIVPRTLVNDQKTLKLTKLNQILRDLGAIPLALH